MVCGASTFYSCMFVYSLSHWFSWTYISKLKERMKEAGMDDPEDIDMSDIMDGIQEKARDHARTPVQV